MNFQLGSFLTAISSSFLSHDAPEDAGELDGASAAWASLLESAASCADSASVGKSRYLACEVTAMVAERMLFLMPARLGSHTAAAAAAGRAAAKLRRTLPRTENDFELAAAMSALVLVECMRLAPYCELFFGGYKRFQMGPFCAATTALAAACVGLMSCVHGSRSPPDMMATVTLTLGSILKSASLALDAAVVRTRENQDRGGMRYALTAEETVELLHMTRVLSLAAAASMAQLGRSDETVDGFHRIITEQSTDLRLIADLGIATLMTDAIGNAATWAAGQAAAYAAIRQGMGLLSRWDVASRVLEQPHEQVEKAVIAAVVGVSLGMTGLGAFPSADKHP